ATLAISVTQPLAGGTLAVRVYREHEAGFVAASLSQSGDKHTATLELPAATPSAYIQVYVDEPATESDPRREAMAMYGVDGGTVPGPSRWDPKAPVYSADGDSVAWPVQPVQLKPGEWVSMQYMVETFPSPSGSTRISDAYRVISWPPDLADRVVVRIDSAAVPILAHAAAARPGSTAQEEPPLVIRYWNGSAWQPVATRVVEGNEGKVASAIIPANAIYALFSGPVQHFLPTVRR
ncbi:MAG TPA: hypothetical protein VNK95_23530, partial [Caldilineaceae bacterium]|nr:hypothetical protein [Caldilineaceae bacterium]